MGLYSGGLIIKRIFAPESLGVYFREGLFLEGLIIGIFRYYIIDSKNGISIYFLLLLVLDSPYPQVLHVFLAVTSSLLTAILDKYVKFCRSTVLARARETLHKSFDERD